MRRLITVVLLAGLAAASFGVAYFAKSAHSRSESARNSIPPVVQDDSVFLTSVNMGRGAHLVAYILVSPTCSVCQRAEIKKLLASVGSRLKESASSRFESIRIVGISINDNPTAGLTYLQELGLAAFDEVAAGRGWRGETLDRLVWRERSTVAAIPQVVVVMRPIVDATRYPLAIRYGKDSVIKIVRGADALKYWANAGFPLTGLTLLDAFAVDSVNETRPITR